MLKTKKGAQGGIKGFILGVLISFVFLLSVSFVMAMIASFSGNPTARVGGYSLFALIVSAFISGIYISKTRGESGVKASVLTALTVTLIMSIAGIVGGGGMPLSLLMNCISYLGVSSLSALLFGRSKRVHRRRH